MSIERPILPINKLKQTFEQKMAKGKLESEVKKIQGFEGLHIGLSGGIQFPQGFFEGIQTSTILPEKKDISQDILYTIRSESRNSNTGIVDWVLLAEVDPRKNGVLDLLTPCNTREEKDIYILLRRDLKRLPTIIRTAENATVKSRKKLSISFALLDINIHSYEKEAAKHALKATLHTLDHIL